METLKDLAGFQHYFLHWNGADKVTSDMIPDKMKALANLQLGTGGSVKFSEDEEECKQMRNLQRRLIPFVHLFLEIVAGDLEKAQEMMNEVEDTMTLMTCDDFCGDFCDDFCDDFYGEEDMTCCAGFSADYISGFFYLHDLVQLHFHLAFKHVANYAELLDYPLKVQDPTQLALEAKYSELGNKSKCVVVLAHWMLISTNRNRRREEPQILMEAAKLDEKNWYWYTLAYNNVRFARKQSECCGAEHAGPSQMEIDLVTNALKHVGEDQSKGRLRCSANLDQCLADIVAFQCKTGKFQSVTLDRKYTNVVSMVDHLKSSATEALFSPNCRFAELIRFGEIFGITLPREYRDYIIAAACLKTLCGKYPDNSKANHKMGAMIINAKRNMKDAIYYLEQAIKLTPRNFAAWMDLLPALLRDYKENEAKVQQVLEDARAQEHQWTETELGAFYFYEGSLAFLTGLHKKAVKLWRKSLEREYNGFTMLGVIRARFGWPNDHPLTFAALRTALDDIRKRQLEVVDQITKLENMVDEADEKTSNFYRHKNAREREDKNWRTTQSVPPYTGRSSPIPPGSWRNHGGSSNIDEGI